MTWLSIVRFIYITYIIFQNRTCDIFQSKIQSGRKWEAIWEKNPESQKKASLETKEIPRIRFILKVVTSVTASPSLSRLNKTFSEALSCDHILSPD